MKCLYYLLISQLHFFDEEGFCKYSRIISKNSVKTFFIAVFVFKKIYQASGYLHFLYIYVYIYIFPVSKLIDYYEQNPPNHVNTSLYYFHTSSIYKIYKFFFFSVQQFCYFFVIFVFYFFYYF